MRNSPRWSNGSVSCRLEWCPSRVLQACLVLIGLLAAISLLICEMPRGLAWPAAVLALARGVWLAHAHGSLPERTFWFPGDGRPATVDGVALSEARLRWRGPLAFLRWRASPGGRWQHAIWWPDTLSARARRELRLAAGDGDAGRPAGPMAP